MEKRGEERRGEERSGYKCRMSERKRWRYVRRGETQEAIMKGKVMCVCVRKKLRTREDKNERLRWNSRKDGEDRCRDGSVGGI